MWAQSASLVNVNFLWSPQTRAKRKSEKNFSYFAIPGSKQTKKKIKVLQIGSKNAFEFWYFGGNL